MKENIIKIRQRAEKYLKIDLAYIVKNSFWWNAGKISSALVSVVLMSAFAHFTTKETFGAYQYVLSIVGLVSIFSLPGMSTAVTKAVSRGKEGDFVPSTKTKFKWSLIGSAILIGFSIWYFYHGNQALSLAILIAAIGTPFLRSAENFGSVWPGRSAFKTLSILEFIGTLMPVVALIITVFLTDSIVTIMSAYFVSQTLTKGALFLYTKHRIKNDEKDEGVQSLGKHLSAMSAFEIIIDQLDNIILWYFSGPTAVAVYSFAQLPILRIDGLIPVQQLALPRLSAQDANTTRKHLAPKVLKISLVMIIPIIFLMLTAPPFYATFFPNYHDSVPYFYILTLILLFIPAKAFETALVAQKQIKSLYIAKHITPTIKLLLYITLIPLYGVLGAVLAHLISRAIMSFVFYYFFRKI